jgi:hypothetical protein
MLGIHAPFLGPNLLHFEPLLSFGFLFLDASLLEEHIGPIEDGRRVAIVRSLLGAEGVQLTRRDLLLVCVVLGRDVAQELRLCDTGFLEVSVDLTADLIACVYLKSVNHQMIPVATVSHIP